MKTKLPPTRAVVLPPGNPEVGTGLDHLALAEALAECTPDGRFHAQELRARLHLTVAAPAKPRPAYAPLGQVLPTGYQQEYSLTR